MAVAGRLGVASRDRGGADPGRGRARSSLLVELARVARVAHVAVERLDVVAVRVEEVGGVVTRSVVAQAGRAVRLEAGLDAGAVEGVDLRTRPRDEAEMKLTRRRLTVDHVHVRQVRLAVV